MNPSLDDYAAEEARYHHEAAVDAAWTGSRLLIGALAFLFGSFAFAYFYLRSLDSHGMWYPAQSKTPPVWENTLVIALVVASAGLVAVAGRRVVDYAAWRRAGWTAFALGLLAVTLQVIELATLKFQPGASGYSSLFTGFWPAYVFVVFLAMMQLEILVMRSRRLVMEPAVQRFQVAVRAFSAVWSFVAAAGVVAWVLFAFVH